MKIRKYYFLCLFLLVGFLMMDHFVNQKMMRLKNPDKISNQVLQNTQKLATDIVQSSAYENIDSVSLLQFKSDFKYEVFQIGQTQANPDQIENRLQGLARQMEPAHRLYLKSILIDTNMNGDDRAMAIELLSRNQTRESAEILKNYTIADADVTKTQTEQEMVHKAQAIEGLAVYQDRNVALAYLDEVTKKTNYQFLQDRARRAEASLKNEGPAIETQDLDALNKIIK